MSRADAPVLNVIVPSVRLAHAVDAVPGLGAVLVEMGGPSLSEPQRRARAGAVPAKVPAHTPAARAIVVDYGPWEQIEAVLAQVPSVELIQSLTAGVDFLRGVPERYAVSNARGAHGPSTAELAMALLLASRRRLAEAVRAQDREEWMQFEPFGATLVGERILVLGAGDLAREFARRAQAFGAEVTFVARRARPGVHGPEDMAGLVASHGVVVVMVSANAATRHLVDASFLRTMPDGATLVNVARGWVVDTDALVAEVRTGRLRAVLDVTDPEPLPSSHPLWHLPGVVITPHLGGATCGVADRAVGVAVEQLRQFATGRLPDNLVPRADLV
jgi:phosphoglycerate dehydrogenase-like enzyme